MIRNLPRIRLILLAFVLWGSQGAEAQATSPDWQEAISGFAMQLARDVEADGIGGISAGVVMGRDLVWGQGFGWADVEKRIPAGVNTIYRVGSISKSFTAIALLQLWERGFLELDDPVSGALPEVARLSDRPAGSDAITFRHLASHTAGLIREPTLEGSTDGPLEYWEDKILAAIPTTSFYARPGESYRYSNIGFGILGYSLSRVTGIPFMELVDASMIRPLGMHSSGFVVTPAVAEQLASGYLRRSDGSVDSAVPYHEHVGRGYKVPNGGIYSTVGDLGRFVAGLTGAATVPALGPEGRRLIRISQTPEGDSRYSFGFSISQREGAPDLVGHGGSVAGYNAHLIFEPESGIGVILLRNYGGGETNLGRAARDLLWRLLEIREASR
ncbi:MAG: beta-lactamase family protein [Gemmatimonadetes bacterium]|nr:beta-lactamase family protein [Gemmatimonadota bacterium]NNM05191.1 beta-lactamase family protein [Gemmatimonadota bacterium]